MVAYISYDMLKMLRQEDKEFAANLNYGSVRWPNR